MLAKSVGCCVSCVNLRFLFALMQGKIFRRRVLLVSICLSLKLSLESLHQQDKLFGGERVNSGL